ncbi:MAG TPA: PH domain-containing protein, partial [Candidatus Paceibacterota bacterium]
EPRVIISSTLGASLIWLIGIAMVAIPVSLIYHLALTPVMILTSAAIIILLTLVYSIVWYNNFRFSFSAERGEIRSSVIATSASFLAYDRIQNVNVHQGIIDRLLGIYSAVIETAGETSSSKFVIFGLNSKNSEILKNFLLDRARAYKKI